MTVDVATDTEIACPPHEVAAFASDPDRVPLWYTHTRAVEWQTDPPLRLGSRIAFVARVLGRTLRNTCEVVELVPGERMVMRSAGGPFPMETTYTWRSTSTGGTMMTLRNRGVPTGFSRLAAPVLGFVIRRANRKDLARLKAILEMRESRKTAWRSP